MNTDGEYIVEGSDGGGFRDFLEGKAIHSGDTIRWWSEEDKNWIYGRYEMDRHTRTGYFYPLELPAVVAPAVILIDRTTMLFRWPMPDD